MDSQPSVAIVIVNWNKKDYLLSLLRSLESLNYNNYEIIVVDNASSDDSVSALKENYPDIELIVTEKNLGGAGGFNTGMRQALKYDKYEFIWLLDNDASVENDTLIELIKALEDDEQIGAAGSMIVNPDNKDLIVELGLNIDWNTGIVKPYLENNKLSEIQEGTHEVDYIPACSAVYRASDLIRTDLMDERYFIWWDDTDLSLSVRRLGHKVVGVTSSVVYHPTEKAWILINYYNVRNTLLAFSKFASFSTRLKIFHRVSSYTSKAIIFYSLTGNKYLNKILFYALYDYLLNNWKQFGHDMKEEPGSSEPEEPVDLANEIKLNFLVLPTGNFDKITETIEYIKTTVPECSVTLLIQDYRRNLFLDSKIDNFIEYQDKSRFILIEHLKLFFKLLFGNYDVAVSPSKESDSPFGYVAKKYYSYNEEEKSIKDKARRRDVWKVLVATVFGEIIALPLTALLMLKSLQYND